MYTTLRDLINNKSSVSKEPVNKRSLSSRRPVSLTLCTCEDVSPWITGRLPHLSVPAGLMVMQWSVNSHIPVHPSDPARRKSEWYFSQWAVDVGTGYRTLPMQWQVVISDKEAPFSFLISEIRYSCWPVRKSQVRFYLTRYVLHELLPLDQFSHKRDYDEERKHEESAPCICFKFVKTK